MSNEFELLAIEMAVLQSEKKEMTHLLSRMKKLRIRKVTNAYDEILRLYIMCEVQIHTSWQGVLCLSEYDNIEYINALKRMLANKSTKIIPIMIIYHWGSIIFDGSESRLTYNKVKMILDYPGLELLKAVFVRSFIGLQSSNIVLLRNLTLIFGEKAVLSALNMKKVGRHHNMYPIYNIGHTNIYPYIQYVYFTSTDLNGHNNVLGPYLHPDHALFILETSGGKGASKNIYLHKYSVMYDSNFQKLELELMDETNLDPLNYGGADISKKYKFHNISVRTYDLHIQDDKLEKVETNLINMDTYGTLLEKLFPTMKLVNTIFDWENIALETYKYYNRLTPKIKANKFSNIIIETK